MPPHNMDELGPLPRAYFTRTAIDVRKVPPVVANTNPPKINWDTQPFANYHYQPPAAPKFFLWDDTRVGPILRTTAHELSNALAKSIRIHACAFNAMMAHFTSDSTIIFEAFMLGRYLETDGIVVLNRFDAGRRASPEDPLRPTVVLDGDLVIKLTFDKMTGSSDVARLSCHAFQELMHEFNKAFRISTPFPLALHFDQSANIFTGRQLVPSVHLQISPINPIRIVPTILSLSLLKSEPRKPEDSSVEFGYITIDQARHVLMLDKSDQTAFQLPLVGIWLKNANSPTLPPVQHACARFLMDARLRRLEIGRPALLVVLVHEAATSRSHETDTRKQPTSMKTTSRYRIAGSSSAGSAPLTSVSFVTSFFECQFESSTYKFTLLGDSRTVRLAASDPDDEKDDIACVLDMEPVEIVQETGFVEALEAEHGMLSTFSMFSAGVDDCSKSRKVEIPQAPDVVVEPVVAVLDVTTSAGGEIEEFNDTVASQQVKGETPSQSTPEQNEEQHSPNDEATAAQNTPQTVQPPPLTPLTLPLDPFQLMQQQQTQMYMMLMQRQYEMMLALTGAQPLSVQATPASMGPKFAEPVLSSNLMSPQLNNNEAPATQQRSTATLCSGPESGNISTTGTACSAQTASTCSIGTNTSLVFDESMFRKSNSRPIEPVTKSETRSRSTSPLPTSFAPINEPSTAADSSLAAVEIKPMTPHTRQFHDSTVSTAGNQKALSTPSPATESRQRRALEGDFHNLPPPDTGNNYKPLFTFDSIPPQSLDQTIIPVGLTTSGVSRSTTRLAGEERNGKKEIETNRKRPPVYPPRQRESRESFAPSPVVNAASVLNNESALAVENLGSLDLSCSSLTSGCVIRDRERGSDGVGGMVGNACRDGATGERGVRMAVTGGVLESRGMISLDLSGIEPTGNDLAADGTFEACPSEEFLSGRDGDDDERTRELIAQLVENPEQSFIFRDVPEEAEERKEQQSSSGSNRPGKQNLLVGLNWGKQSLQHDLPKPKSYGRNLVSFHEGLYDVSESREQFSKATLEYLAKYKLT